MRLIMAIENRQVVDVLEHPRKKLYKDYKLILVRYKNYIYSVLIKNFHSGDFYICVVLPSRFYTKRYIEDKYNA